MNGFRRIAAAGLCTCLVLGSLSGCSKKEKAFDASATAITVNGDEISAGLVKFTAHYSQSMMEDLYKMYMGISDPMSYDVYGNGSTMGDMIKAESVALLERMVLAEQNMSDYGVELTDEEKAAVKEAAAQFVSDNGEEVLEKMCATQETVERYLTLRVIQNKMEPELSADVDTEVSDDEAAQRKVNYVLFRAETEAETEEETGIGASEEESEAETAGETAADDEAETAGETSADAETVADAGTEAETSADAETEAETAALTEEDSVKTKSAEETEAVTEAGTAAETDAADTEQAATEAETDAASADTEASTEAETGAEASTDASGETETETETEDPAMVAAKAEARALAEQMIEKVKGGEDFETAASEVDEDAACSTLTFGSDSTTISAALIEATEGLEDGTLVEEPIEIDSGYYVAQVISKLDREATDEKKEEIVEDRKSDRVEEVYTEWTDAAEIEENEEVLAKVVFDISLTQATEAETESGTEAAGETESESGTEMAGETESGSETETETETSTVTADETESEQVTEAEEPETAGEAATEAETEPKVTEAASTEADETESGAAEATEAVSEAAAETESEGK